jgi:hypothetical protein
LGFDGWKYASVSLKAIDEGLIEERAFCKVTGERKGLAKLLSMPGGTGKHAAVCPRDAMAFVSMPLDGKEVYGTILEMIRKIDQRDTERFEKDVEEVEMGAGLKVADGLLAAIRGESAVWCVGPAGAVPSPYPELGAAIEAADAAAAAELADGVAKLLCYTCGDKNAVGKAAYKGRSCHWLKLLKSKDVPYTPSWCADGRRLLASSSQEGLQRLIRRIDADKPGLDTNGDFKCLLKRIPARQRGGMIYLNSERALGWVYRLCLPLVTSLASDETAAELKDAPQDVAVMLKGFPGTLFTLAGVDDGVEARSIGGLPTSGLVATTPFAFIVQYRMLRRKARAEAQARAIAKEQALKAGKDAEAARKKRAETEKKKAEKE